MLEHVEDSISLAFLLASAIRIGGYVLFDNCFFSMVKCHLSSAFYLRYAFRWVMNSMRLRHLGSVTGAEHAQLFERIGPLDSKEALSTEQFARVLGPALNGIFRVRDRAAGLLASR